LATDTVDWEIVDTVYTTSTALALTDLGLDPNTSYQLGAYVYAFTADFT
jgi:hypothetical protein